MEQNKIESKNRDLLSGSKKSFDPHQPRCDWDYIPNDLLGDDSDYYCVHYSDCNPDLLDYDQEPEPIFTRGCFTWHGFLRGYLARIRLPVYWRHDPFFQFIPCNDYFYRIKGLVYPYDLLALLERWGVSSVYRYRLCIWFIRFLVALVVIVFLGAAFFR